MKLNKQTIKNLPVIKQLIVVLQQIEFPSLQGSSLYDIIKLYVSGLISGDVTHRASAIAFSFFMALFPFALFLLKFDKSRIFYIIFTHQNDGKSVTNSLGCFDIVLTQ